MNTIAILSPGDMGHAVGRTLSEKGLRVVTCLEGRSTRTRGLAEAAGLIDLPSLEAMVTETDLVLSIMPPSAAVDVARSVAIAMSAVGRRPAYADCNAISPATTSKIASEIGICGGPFIDAGIVGPPPARVTSRPGFMSVVRKLN